MFLPDFLKEDVLNILESSYDGIWITDGEGKVLFANSANANILGVKKENLINQYTHQLLKDKVFSDSVILEVIRTKTTCTKISHNYHTGITVLATATPIFDDNKEIKYIVNNVRDITKLNNLKQSILDKDVIINKKTEELELLKVKYGFENIIGSSKKFIDTLKLAYRVASFDGCTVLILGESGTGKEVISETIVKNSDRKDKPFLKINCGAIPEQLLESELFGYEKGAFTGANAKGKVGLFEAANGGTILLDEIGDLPLHLQVKLLRVIQQKQIFRIGSCKPISLDVRIIAATHKNLDKMVSENSFREDLYYRLNVVSINIPPLRERSEDIIPLINFFLKIFNNKYKTNKTIHTSTIEVFNHYYWPGNIRELENLVENLVITSIDNVITKEDLPDKLFSNTCNNEAIVLSEIVPLKTAVNLVEKNLINQAMLKYGSTRKAAKVLGVNASTIVRKLQSYNSENEEVIEKI